MAMVKGRELAKMIADKKYGRKGTQEFIRQAFESGEMTGHHFSLRDLARHLVADGSEWLSDLEYRQNGLMEASQAVDTGAMSGIIGQIIFSTIKQAFDNAALVGDQLVTTMPSNFQDEEIVPGVGKSSSSTVEVEEGQPYPRVGLAKDATWLPRAKKHGDILGITREMLIADRTGVLVSRAQALGEGHAHNREEEILNTVTGNGALYKYSTDASQTPTGINPYQAATPYINTVAKTLTDYTDIDEAEQLLTNMTDPLTGRPILTMADTIWVPPALRATARRIVGAFQVNSGDITTGAGIQTVAGNVFKGSYTVVDSIYVKRATSSDTQWFFGAPKKAFVWKEIWPMDVEPAPANHPAAFEADIMMQWKASYKGVAGVMDPRHVCKFT